MGFDIIATDGTAKVLNSSNINCQVVRKIGEGNVDLLDLVKNGKIGLIIDTPSGARGQTDVKPIRSAAVMHGISCITTIQGAQAAVNGIESILKGDFSVKSIQEYTGEKKCAKIG